MVRREWFDAVNEGCANRPPLFPANRPGPCVTLVSHRGREFLAPTALTGLPTLEIDAEQWTKSIASSTR